MANIELIKKLSKAFGVSSFENEVIDILREELKGYVDSIEVDEMQNLIALKNFDSPKSKVMLNAHMDEVGLFVKNVTPSGFIKFVKVGGIDDRVLLGKRVIIGEKKVRGVIATKPIHLQKESEKDLVDKSWDMVIDIGAKTKEEALKLVQVGEGIAFDTEFEEIGDGFFVGKAFDDRLGCAIIAEVLKEEFDFPLIALFSSQEETGLRGVTTGAFKYTADISITIEGTVSSDFPDVSDFNKVSVIGDGPVITVKDASVITDHDLRKRLIETAEKFHIPYQYKRVAVGGTDSSKIQVTKEGVKVLVMAVPVRYIRSPVSLFYLDDYENTKRLLVEFLHSLEG